MFLLRILGVPPCKGMVYKKNLASKTALVISIVTPIATGLLLQVLKELLIYTVLPSSFPAQFNHTSNPTSFAAQVLPILLLAPNEPRMNNNMQLYVHRCHIHKKKKKKKTQEQRTTAFTKEKGCTGFIDVVNFMTSQHMTQYERQA
jgi:hypothetical protein